jgi:hypothetical protein
MPKPSVYIAGQQVDLAENELDKLLSNHAITDSENLQNRASSVSTVIKASGSRSNRKLFGNLQLAASQSNIEDGVDARVEFQGITTLRGQYKFVKTIRKGNSIEYHFMIVGQNSWSQLLAQKTMNQVNLSAYDHFLSAETILWSQANTDKSVFLYTHPQAANDTEVMPAEFDLAFNVRRLFLEIFKSIGFRVVSDFIDSDYFSRIWYHPLFLEKDSEYWSGKTAVVGNENALSFATPAGSGIQEIEVPLEFDLDDPEITVSGDLINTGLKDPNNHFDTTDLTYKVSEDGGYRVSFKFNFTSAGTILADVNILYLYIDGLLQQQQINILKQEILDNDVKIDVTFEDLFLKAGQEISIKMTYAHDYSTTTPRQYNAAPYSTVLKVEGLTQLSNYERIFINDYFLSQQDIQLNFISDCAVLFNLQFISDEYTKTVLIEPEGNFYTDDQESLDNRIDGAKTIDVRRAASLLAKQIQFRYLEAETGGDIFNETSSNGTQSITLAFFNKTPLVDAELLYAGVNVLDGVPNNNLFYYQGSKDVEKHQVYRFNNDYSYQPGPNVIPEVEALPDIRFTDVDVNLNFETVDSPGLLKLFYSALPARINSIQRQIEAYINWSILDISRLNSAALDNDNGFRKAYHSHEHGKLRLLDITNFDAVISASTKSLFVQDIPHAEFATSLHSQVSLVDLAEHFVMIANVYVERIDSFPNPVDIGYTIGFEQIGLIAEYATGFWPYYNSLDNVTIKTNPNGFRSLIKTVGSGDLPDVLIRDQSVEVSVYPPSVNYKGLAPLHFYSDNFTHPVWLSGYGYYSTINAGVAFELFARIRSISTGSYATSTCYATLSFIDPPSDIIGNTFSMPINTDDYYIFNLSLAQTGIYTYTIFLYSDYQGATQLVDQITSKLYVHV